MTLPLFDHCEIEFKDYRHPLFGTWHAMIYRCTSVLDIAWFAYGGRGITVCHRWMYGEHRKTGFRCWLLDMGPKPTSEHSIDRIDSNGNYEPLNCRWATPKVQIENRRKNPIKICPAAKELRMLMVRTYHYKNMNKGKLKQNVKALLMYGEPVSYYEDRRHLNGILA